MSFGVQEKKLEKNSCFFVSLFRCFAVSWFSDVQSRTGSEVRMRMADADDGRDRYKKKLVNATFREII